MNKFTRIRRGVVERYMRWHDNTDTDEAVTMWQGNKDTCCFYVFAFVSIFFLEKEEF